MTGKERFSVDGKELDENLNSFWSWAYSELDSNIVRSAFAEYIVAMALGITDEPGESFRVMWRPFDLKYKDVRVEVKSASTIQTWKSKKNRNFKFDVAPARTYDEQGSYIDGPIERNCDVYVFCIFDPEDENTNPMELDKWRFLVLPTRVLNEHSLEQKTITLSSLMKLQLRECAFSELKETIDEVV